MEVTVTPTKLDGVFIIDTRIFRDERGFFLESYNKRDFAERGLCIEFVQDNHSRSTRNVLRGIHYQDMTAPIDKLVRCTSGRILDVAVDLRFESPTFGQWVAVELTADNMRQLLVPTGFGHGFATLSDYAEVQYKCSNYYTPSAEGAILWNDAEIAIDWPVAEPIISQRDQAGMSLADYRRKPVFTFASQTVARQAQELA